MTTIKYERIIAKRNHRESVDYEPWETQCHQLLGQWLTTFSGKELNKERVSDE